MARGETRQHTSNNRKAKSLGNGKVARQDACHKRSQRLAASGVTEGTKCGIESARLERATNAAREAWVEAVTALNEKWTPKGRDKERDAASHLRAAEIAERNF